MHSENWTSATLYYTQCTNILWSTGIILLHTKIHDPNSLFSLPEKQIHLLVQSHLSYLTSCTATIVTMCSFVRGYQCFWEHCLHPNCWYPPTTLHSVTIQMISTNTTELNLWEATSHSATQELPHISGNLKVHYNVHKSTEILGFRTLSKPNISVCYTPSSQPYSIYS
jgi:hypothetical protein